MDTQTDTAIDTTSVEPCEHAPAFASWSEPVTRPPAGVVMFVEHANACRFCGAGLVRLARCELAADGSPGDVVERGPWMVSRPATEDSRQWARLRLALSADDV